MSIHSVKETWTIFLFIIVFSALHGQEVSEAHPFWKSDNNLEDNNSLKVTNKHLSIVPDSPRYFYNMTNNVNRTFEESNVENNKPINHYYYFNHFLHHHHHHQNDDEQLDEMKPKLWNYGIVPYEISHHLYKHRNVIESAMHHISSNAACVQFLKRNDDIWEDYINIVWNDNNRCRSYIGRIGGVQTLELSDSCINFGTILHELMHALGFHHEHSRPDRDKYLDISWNNIDPNDWYNFEKISNSQFRNVSEFDYHSIMIYDEYAFSDNYKPTIIPRDHSVRLIAPRDKRRLSHLDIYSLQQLYCH